MDLSDQIIIENVHPSIDCGSVPYKTNEGSKVTVSADIYIHGTEVLDASIKHRKSGEKSWKRSPLVKGDNDRWSGEFLVEENGVYEYTLEAWVDHYTGLSRSLGKWFDAGEDVSADLMSIAKLTPPIMEAATDREKRLIKPFLGEIRNGSNSALVSLAESEKVARIFRKYQEKYKLTTFEKILRIESVPKYGGFSSWYEAFPRSLGKGTGKGGTFKDCENFLPYVKSLGFDVLYLTPIHPIGRTNRRGKNGSRTAGKKDPGSPWAIGNEEGGHKSVNPDLGTIDDFKSLVKTARSKGIEIALDIAFQCSPDHPYVREHPEWFYHRPDGTIRYAENPPKKYYDIYPINFENPDWKNLWEELKSIFLYWIDAGVRIFRVDNPHTKPFDFWEKIISDIKAEHPDAVFFAEAFTRPKVMYRLSKIGFTCSYSYFTWRNYDWEIRDYFTEISQGAIGDHFRPVLFTNTPDILTAVLVNGGRNAFMMRAALAATLSPMWGMYSGYELCENSNVPGSEEYLDSEKYEIKSRNYNSRGNIKAFITSLNKARKQNRQLQSFRNTEFLEVSDHNFVAYLRWADDPTDPLLVIVNINPFEDHSTSVRFPLWKLGMQYGKDYNLRDLLSGRVYQWRDEYNTLELTRGNGCALILRLER